jgi:hypothetical protein
VWIGAIVAMAFGVVAVVACLALGTLWCICCRGRRGPALKGSAGRAQDRVRRFSDGNSGPKL